MAFGLIVAGLAVFLVLRVVYQGRSNDSRVPGWSQLRSSPEARRRFAQDAAGKVLNAVLILSIVWAIWFSGWFGASRPENEDTAADCDAEYGWRIDSAPDQEARNAWENAWLACVESEEANR